MRAACLLLVLAACVAQGDLGEETPRDDPTPDPTPAPDPAAWLWASDEVFEVEVELEPDAWAQLRAQSRNWVDVLGGDCLAEPFESPYTWFEGSLTLDGLEASGVGVRKKGFLGSLSWDRPSMKLDLDRFVEGQALDGLTSLTLNNGVQDPSLLRTCLAFRSFADLEVPAPRCRFAHVTVNGEDLGPYTAVEGYDEAFLHRQFGDGEGTLWEGTLSDFRDGWLGTFDQDSNQATPRDEPLLALRDALTHPDAEGTAPIEAVVDLPAFNRFWAAESLLGHWDGYAGNTNNFFVYEHPKDGRLRFIPWGPDAILDKEAPFGPDHPVAVTAEAALPHRLLELPAARAAWTETMRTLLAEAWREEAVLARIETFETLLEPFIPIEFRTGWRAQVAALEEISIGRRAAIEAEIDAAPPAWPFPLRDPLCLVAVGGFEANFTTTWGTLEGGDPWAQDDIDLILEWGGNPLPTVRTATIAGVPSDAPALARFVWLADLGGDAYGLIVLETDPARVHDGAVLSVDFVEASGQMLYQDASTGGQWVQAAWLGDTVLTLTQAGTGPGDLVTGTLTGDLLGFNG